MIKNIIVTDNHGNNIGSTYPKRAKGLVKSGRAHYVDDCTIRLSAAAVPSDHKKSEVNHMNYILFNPRGWFLEESHGNGNGNRRHGTNPFPDFNFNFNGPMFNGAMNENVPPSFTGTRPVDCCFISDFDPNKLVEMVQFGDWGNRRCSIVSDEFPLHPDTDYSFVFWLNGGENERGDEECQLHITYSRQFVFPSIYKLNRGFIKPLLHYMGWELYQIPFHTAPGEQDIVTQFRFIAKGAPMALKPAATPDTYKDLADSPDPYAAFRPQRHNIVFEDGWPSLNMHGGNQYSTEIVRRLAAAQTGEAGDSATGGRPQSVSFYQPEEEQEEEEPDVDELNINYEPYTGDTN